ncbi:winged helix-turn-helix transcriptional regulator [Wenzhouxiangella marina]|uniref:Putative transcriptional regulator HxlR family n=1 Tax=Wenzhouxiangella marina TaxID=1579979 RepID=A0A0K0XSE2_9GAMM|nr:helix-turn-helix domain-containing protein [Wenzhouxiangella marina]AKS40603.1 Putative transcriptional regulator HxlR family [Wenzhouxiangella marina]MBB6088371.1 DNA-binding HxlR family transcriptional regulator [Wenzhouxiangella marina]
MSRSDPLDSNCPIARVTALIGEPWTLLVLREAFWGCQQFKDFEASLGIARNILADRLRKLVEAGLLSREPNPEDRRRVDYRLTERGRALMPALIALAQWSGEHLCDADCAVRFVERRTGKDVAPVSVRAQDGRVLGIEDLSMVPGEDADPELLARLSRAGLIATRNDH